MGDGLLQGRACILPVLEEQSSRFNGQEYLGIYPYVEYAKVQSSNKDEFWVVDPEEVNKYTSLQEWLNGNELTYH